MRKPRHMAVLLAFSLCSSAPALAQENLPSRSGEGSRPVPVAVHASGVVENTGSSFRSLLGTLGRDLARLPSKETALTLGIGGAIALATYPTDRDRTRRARLSERLDNPFAIGDPLGSGWVQVGGALGIFVVGHAIKKPRLKALGVDLVRAQAVNGLLTRGIKVSVGRARPDGSRHSFPSGHSSAAFATAAVCSSAISA